MHSTQSTAASLHSPSPRITGCTLTGADDHTDPKRLWELSQEFPFVEWGILYSKSQQGEGRYPSYRWISRLAKNLGNPWGPKYALHICGSAVKDLLAGEELVNDYCALFNRIQINFIASNHDLGALREVFDRFPNQTIITQHNAANYALWPQLSDKPNHAILFDGSGGRGKSPMAWPDYIDGMTCGYAGGLGPDNLETECLRIAKAANGHAIWLDMEGKLRDDSDRFDLAKAKACLQIVASIKERGK